MATERICRDLKDELARDRTILANERTFLAYIRTAIMLLASGTTLVKLLRVDPLLRVVGYVLIPLSIAIGTIGYVRYTRTRKELKMISREGC